MSDDLKKIETEISKTIEMIRPYIQQDGGDIRFDRYDSENQIVYVELLGACIGCLFADMTIQNGVQAILTDEHPKWVKEVMMIENDDWIM